MQGIGAAFLIANSVAILTDAFPAQPARARARDQQRRRDQRPVHRPRPRRPARRRSTGGSSSSSRCRSASSARSGRTASLREIGVHQRGADRLVGQRHVRGRPRARHDRDHLRHPALRRPSDGLDEPVRARLRSPPGSRCSRSSPGVETRVEAPMFELSLFRIRAVHVRRPLELPLGARARRADVHADHLAAGHLAARSTATASPRTPLWAGIYMLPLTVGFLIAGPISGILSDRYGSRAVRDRRDARLGARVRAARAAADRLLLPGVRGDPAS